MSETPVAPVTPVSKGDALPDRISLQGLFGKFLALAGLAYGVGFTVILTHTATLKAPVIEPFQAQTVVAGLPVWLLICVGVWTWPAFMRRIMRDRKTLSKSVVQGLITTAISLTVLILGAIWFGAKTGARDWPFSVVLFSLCGLGFALTIFFAVWSHKSTWIDPGVPSLFSLICFWTGFVFVVVSYALLIYPIIPHNYGGGHPTHIRIIFKEPQTPSLLPAETGVPKSGHAPDEFLLFYRTSSYLLVSREENQPLDQIFSDQVRAIEWQDSQPH